MTWNKKYRKWISSLILLLLLIALAGYGGYEFYTLDKKYAQLLANYERLDDGYNRAIGRIDSLSNAAAVKHYGNPDSLRNEIVKAQKRLHETKSLIDSRNKRDIKKLERQFAILSDHLSDFWEVLVDPKMLESIETLEHNVKGLESDLQVVNDSIVLLNLKAIELSNNLQNKNLKIEELTKAIRDFNEQTAALERKRQEMESQLRNYQATIDSFRNRPIKKIPGICRLYFNYPIANAESMTVLITNEGVPPSIIKDFQDGKYTQLFIEFEFPDGTSPYQDLAYEITDKQTGQIIDAKNLTKRSKEGIYRGDTGPGRFKGSNYNSQYQLKIYYRNPDEPMAIYPFKFKRS